MNPTKEIEKAFEETFGSIPIIGTSEWFRQREGFLAGYKAGAKAEREKVYSALHRYEPTKDASLPFRLGACSVLEWAFKHTKHETK